MATWAEDIVAALTALGGTGTYDQIYAEVARRRLDLPPSWKDIIRRHIQDRSSDSAGYKGVEDLFFSVNGLGRGVWGLRALVEETPIAADLPVDLQERSLDREVRELPSGSESPRRGELTIYRVLRDTKLARGIKLLHRDQCQICGVALQITSTKTYSEAHHIIPLGSRHNGPDVAENIIVLCPNHHALCDMGAMRLDRSMIRTVPGHEISDKSIDYHNTKIVGSFDC